MLNYFTSRNLYYNDHMKLNSGNNKYEILYLMQYTYVINKLNKERKKKFMPKDFRWSVISIRKNSGGKGAFTYDEVRQHMVNMENAGYDLHSITPIDEGYGTGSLFIYHER